jgi:hypothetical protein
MSSSDIGLSLSRYDCPWNIYPFSEVAIRVISTLDLVIHFDYLWFLHLEFLMSRKGWRVD